MLELSWLTDTMSLLLQQVRDIWDTIHSGTAEVIIEVVLLAFISMMVLRRINASRSTKA